MPPRILTIFKDLFGLACTFIVVYYIQSWINNNIIFYGLPLKGTHLSRPDHEGQETYAVKTRDRTFLNQGVLSSGIKVLINSKYRTGSSYAGEFFYRNPEFMYLFEPLYNINDEYRFPPEGDIPSLLEKIFQCQFDDPDVSNLYQRGWIWNMFCRWGTGDTCDDDKPNVDRAMERCRRLQNRAVKLIRLNQLETIDSLLRQGVKVIQLLRDPRGMTASRIENPSRAYQLNNSSKFLEKEARDYCEMALNDLEYMNRLYSRYGDVILSVFHIIRYEDLAENPSKGMQQIYDFLGRQPDHMVIDWARKAHTQSSQPIKPGNFTFCCKF